jgi:hypothetical protein
MPDSLDAMAAAPDHHQVLLENDQVRVLDTRSPPGATTPVHSHRWAGVLYVLSWSDFVRYDRDGNVVLDSRTFASRPEKGAALWSPPLGPHRVKKRRQPGPARDRRRAEDAVAVSEGPDEQHRDPPARKVGACGASSPRPRAARRAGC